MSSIIPEITVIFATCNRADIVCHTLASFQKLDLQGLQVEFVVVDNNSVDDTREVVRKFNGELPITYLFEGKPGKNRALNRALTDSTLGEIVVFTDDDIVPNPDWLQQIKAVSERWPDYKVFGGRVDLKWPDLNIPPWARELADESWVFAVHDLAAEEILYPPKLSPVGPNMWVRKELFAKGRLFIESIGPRPSDRTMGSETSFLVELENDGYKSIYSPRPIVQHRVDPRLLQEKKILERAYSNGRGSACCMNMLKGARERYTWNYNAHLVWRIGKYSFLAFLSYLLPSRNRQVITRVRAYQGFAMNLQMLRFAFPNRR